MRSKLGIIILVVVVFAAVVAVIGFTVRGRKNHARVPPDKTFSGEWIVYSWHSGKVVLKSFYTNGVKHGTETSWTEDSWSSKVAVDTVQTYSNGVLHGKYTRFDFGGRPVLQGDYVNGEPWVGNFLTGADGVLDSPFTPRDLIPDTETYAVRYVNGVAAEHGRLGAKGYEPLK